MARRETKEIQVACPECARMGLTVPTEKIHPSVKVVERLCSTHVLVTKKDEKIETNPVFPRTTHE